MTGSETGRIGKRGTFVIPAALLRLFGLDEGSLIIVEERPEGILIRPVIATEAYPPERKAAFLLENAVDAKDYGEAERAVRDMGLDPSRISHAPAPRQRKRRKAPPR